MTSLPWFLEIVVGVGMGFCSGLFGLGGSSIGTPILRLLGLPPLIALASTYITECNRRCDRLSKGTPHLLACCFTN